VTALELQPDLNETGARLTARCGLGERVEHACGDILSGVVAGRDFDALISMLCFLHIPDRQTLFSQCHAALRPGGRIFIEDYYARGPLTAAERGDLSDKVYCSYLPSLDDYQAQLHAAGFEEIELLDLTADWGAFVAERLSAFRAARDRQVALHGTDLVEGLDDFYGTVSALFAGGRLGGTRIVARRP
jgi:SAM-dependent methyltransferase